MAFGALLSVTGVLSAQDVPITLEGLVVTGSPTPRPSNVLSRNVTVLDGRALREIGISRVVDALATVPGLAVVQGGSFGATTSLFLRGGESNHTLVLLDGVQLNQPGGSVDLAGLTLDNVERIEVVRGASSALYGSDAAAGVVHIITRVGSGATRGSVAARLGSYGRRDWEAGASGGGPSASYSVGLTHQATDGILDLNNRHTNTVLSGAARLELDQATRGRFTLRVGKARYHFPTDGSGNVVDTNQFTYGDEATVGAALTRSVGSRVELELLLGHHVVDGGTDDAPDGAADTLGFYGFSSLDHVRRSSAEVRGNVRLGDAVATVGAEYEEQAQRSFTESASEYGPSSGRSEYDRWNRAAFAHLTAARGRWGLDAGARLEDNERYGSAGTWQAGASFSPHPRMRLRAAAGRSIKEPTFFETFATGFARGNPDLAPERVETREVGLDVTVSGGWAGGSLTAFDHAYRDLIQYTPTPLVENGPNYYNVARATGRGIEASAHADAGGWRAAAGWAWLDSRVDDPGVDEGPGAEFVDGESLLRRPRHTLTLDVTRSTAAASLGAGVRRVGRRYDRDFGTFPATRVVLSAYTDVHASITVRPTARLDLTLRAVNLLDRGYQEVLGFDAPGRTLEVTGRVGLGEGR